MRPAFGQFRDATPEFLRFAAQYGVQDVLLNTPHLPDHGGTWAEVDLVGLRRAVASHGLTLSAIENVPPTFYDHIMLGGPKRDQQIENMITTIRNIARAGIPIFGYHWMPSHVWRTTPKVIRGGAIATAFDLDEAKRMPLTHGREYTEDEMWANLEYWIRIITPVAEEEGIRLGIHPCDPPTETLGGIPQLFRSYDAYRRYLAIVDSPHAAIEFCQGTISQMRDSAGDALYGFIDEMVRRDRVLYVHFRNVSAPNPDHFHEEFINTGHVDMYRAMTTYRDAGYRSFFIDDHVPETFQDSDWGHRGRAFANGYIQAMIEAVTKQAASR